ncbi:hypothetical protein N0V82_004837 [Gnomoniopsis sp. IMI 355080]|nr:hypothetical protein N0V82_004837 [Gnomoniopsis sp. IMI 355080]
MSAHEDTGTESDTMDINAATVASITPILRLTNAKFQRDTGVTDLTFYSLPLLYWTNVEYNMGMVAGSMGVLRPLFTKLVGGLTSGNSGSCLSSGDQADGGPAYNLFTRSKRRVRGAASRVQGDSVLQTANSVTGSVPNNARAEGDSAALQTLFEVPSAASKK